MWSTWIQGRSAGQGIVFGLSNSALNRVYNFRRVCSKQEKVARLSSFHMVCPKQGPEMEGDVLLRVVILVFFCCPKQGQVSIPSAAPHPNLGQVSPPPPPSPGLLRSIARLFSSIT